ncbi:hypothetical protein ACFLSE_04925 [Bacteroidota bacterium]
MDFLKWYKYRIESNEVDPPGFIWENIQDELDIDQTWNTINDHLVKKSANRRNRVLAIAASVMILIFAGTYWLLKPDVSQRNFQTLTEEVKQVENEINIAENILDEELFVEEIITLIEVNESENKPLIFIENIIAENIFDTTKEEKINKNYNTELVYAKLDIKNITLDYNKNEDLILADNNISEITKQEKNSKRTAFRKLYIGSTGQLANTWLLNEKTYNGLESSSLTSSNASFGSNFGIFAGTNLTKNIDLQLDINILAQNNQSYNEYLNGHYIENKMRFNYSQLALSFRYYMVSKRFIQGEHGINMGGYLGYLHNAYQTLENETINLTSNYNTLDYGVFISYEYIIPLYKQLGLGTGFRAYYGLQNIYAGNNYIPAYLNKTNNASINISLSLKYAIK